MEYGISMSNHCSRSEAQEFSVIKEPKIAVNNVKVTKDILRMNEALSVTPAAQFSKKNL